MFVLSTVNDSGSASGSSMSELSPFSATSTLSGLSFFLKLYIWITLSNSVKNPLCLCYWAVHRKTQEQNPDVQYRGFERGAFYKGKSKTLPRKLTQMFLRGQRKHQLYENKKFKCQTKLMKFLLFILQNVLNETKTTVIWEIQAFLKQKWGFVLKTAVFFYHNRNIQSKMYNLWLKAKLVYPLQKTKVNSLMSAASAKKILQH